MLSLNFKAISNKEDLNRLISHILCHYSDIQSPAIGLRMCRTSMNYILLEFCYREVMEHKFHDQYSSW